MAFQQFNEDVYFKTSDTSEEIRMGSFQVQESGELAHIRVWFYGAGMSSVTNESIKLKVYSDGSTTSDFLMFESDESLITDIGATGDYWLGFLRCDFNKENLNPNLRYWLNATFPNYTRGTTLFGLCYDYPYPWYVTSGATTFYEENIAFQIFTYR